MKDKLIICINHFKIEAVITLYDCLYRVQILFIIINMIKIRNNKDFNLIIEIYQT